MDFKHGLRICRRFFMHLHNISRTRLLNLQKHLKENWLVPRIKRSGGRQNNKHSLSFNDTQTVVTFICNYAEAHAVSLPGRIPGFMNFNIRLLPSSTTKKDVHKLAGRYAMWRLHECGEVSSLTFWSLNRQPTSTGHARITTRLS